MGGRRRLENRHEEGEEEKSVLKREERGEMLKYRE